MTILLKSLKRAQNSLTPSQRQKMEREQDIEHTYYSMHYQVVLLIERKLRGCVKDIAPLMRLFFRF